MSERPMSALAEHYGVEVDCWQSISCALGSCDHDTLADCPVVAEKVCASCAGTSEDSDLAWYEQEHLYPCAFRQQAERLQVEAFGFDVRFEAVERAGFSAVLDHATRSVAAFQTELAAKAAAAHLDHDPGEHVDWYRWAPDPEAHP